MIRYARLLTSGLYTVAPASDIDFGTAPTMDLTGQTTLAYVYPTATGGGGFATVWSKNHPRLQLFHNVGSPCFGFAGSSTGSSGNPTRTAAANSAPYNHYWHIAATWNGTINFSGIHVYQGMDGAPLTEPAYLTETNGATTPLYGVGQGFHVGNRSAGDRAFEGAIFYVVRWNRVLFLSELIRAQQYGPLTVPLGLVFCWANGRDYMRTDLFGSHLAPTSSANVKVSDIMPRNPLLGTLAAPYRVMYGTARKRTPYFYRNLIARQAG